MPIKKGKEYIKKILSHGKQLVGKSVDNPSLLGIIMLICLNGRRGPNFLQD